MNRLLGLIVALLASSPCLGFFADKEIGQDGLSLKTDVVFGGRSVVESDDIWRSTVFLQLFGCTGVLVGPHAVLTAAHCFSASDVFFVHPGANVDASLARGEYDENFKAMASGVSPVEVRLDYPEPPRYAVSLDSSWRKRLDPNDFQNDLEIMTFSGDIPDGFKTVKMLQDRSVLKPGVEVVVAGFGLTGPRSDARGFKTTTLRITKVSERWFLAADLEAGVNSCSGDSGGPAFVRIGDEYYLAGITVWTDHGACNSAGTVGFNLIPFYKDWVAQYLPYAGRADQTRTCRSQDCRARLTQAFRESLEQEAAEGMPSRDAILAGFAKCRGEGWTAQSSFLAFGFACRTAPSSEPVAYIRWNYLHSSLKKHGFKVVAADWSVYDDAPPDGNEGRRAETVAAIPNESLDAAANAAILEFEAGARRP